MSSPELTDEVAVKSPPVSKSSRAKALTAGIIGNYVEWFDFTAYGAVAIIIAMHFFPSDDPVVSLISSFGALAVGFLFRGLGGFLFGAIGDRLGRRQALSYAILLMSAATFAIGILPAYASIGVWAPALLILMRCAQGLANGGEWSSSAIFMVEYGNERQRSFYGSFTPAGAWLGAASGIGLVALVTAILGYETVVEWAWRVPFLVAGPLGIIGLIIRLTLADTPDFRKIAAAKKRTRMPIRKAIRTNWRRILIVMLISGVHAAFVYSVIAYMVSYMIGTVGIDPSIALTSNTIAAGLAAIPTVLIGLFSDRIGRRNTLIIGGVLMSVLTIPMFMLIGTGVIFFVFLGQIVLTFMVPFLSAPLSALVVELFPADIRATGAAIGNAVGGAILGGGFPMLAVALVSSTGNPVVPAWVLTFLAVFTLIVVLVALRETRGKPLPEIVED